MSDQKLHSERCKELGDTIRKAVQEMFPDAVYVEGINITRDTMEVEPRGKWKSSIAGPWMTVSVRILQPTTKAST